MLFLVQDESSESATEVNFDIKFDVVADKEHGVSEDTLVASDSKMDLLQVNLLRVLFKKMQKTFAFHFIEKMEVYKYNPPRRLELHSRR